MDNNSSTPPIGSNLQSSSSSAELPSSPLERLDPQRLRDQAVASHLGQHALQGHWSPVPSNMSVNSPARTPQSVQSPSMINQQRHSSGSVESLQQFTNQQFFPSQETGGYGPDYAQQQRAQMMQNQSPRPVLPGQLGSPHASPSFPVQASNSSQLANQKAQQQAQYKMMTINGQTMYAAIPAQHAQTPGIPTTAGPPKVAYHVPSGGQFAYVAAQPPPGQSNQQWIAIPSQQMHLSGQQRLITQQLPRGGVVHRLPQGYPTSMPVYAANIPGSPHPQRIAIRPQPVTTQPQQNIPNTPQTPGTPATPVNMSAPATPAPQGMIPGQGFYPPPGYPSNYPQNGGQVNAFQPQARPPAPPPQALQSPAVRQFVPTNNAPPHGNPQAPPPQPSHYTGVPNVNGGPLRPKGAQHPPPKQGQPQPLQAPPAHFNNFPGASAIPPQQGGAKQPGDMRSPAIISPNQPIPMMAGVPSAMPPANMAQLTPRPQHLIRMPQQFFYSEPSGNVPQEHCLAGCSFLLVENPAGVEARTMAAMIKYYGGDIEVYNPRCTSDKATHVICDYLAHLPQTQENKNKRICTTVWLNDVIERKRLEPPFKVCHLPCLIATKNQTLADKIITITGFVGTEVSYLKHMIQMVGAKFSPFLSKLTNILIAKAPNSPKIEKAVKCFSNVQIVNLSWIYELYLGFNAPIADATNRRFHVTTMIPIELGPINLSKLHENVARLMVPWQYPIAISEENMNRAKDYKTSVLTDEFIAAPNLRVSNNEIIPTVQQIEEVTKIYEKNEVDHKILIAFSGLNAEEQAILTKKLLFLGIKITDNVESCTFLIAPHLLRTTSIFKAIALGKNIISPMWVTTCFIKMKIIDTDDFILRDPNNEKALGCNLRASILVARQQPIFENMVFYVSPNVKPSRSDIQSIIESGGGMINTSKPSRFELSKYFEADRLYIIICSPLDLIYFQEFTEKNIPIFSEEFVFCAIMRQKIDTTNFFAINLAPPTSRTGSALAKAPVTPVQKNPLLPSTTSQVKA